MLLILYTGVSVTGLRIPRPTWVSGLAKVWIAKQVGVLVSRLLSPDTKAWVSLSGLKSGYPDP